MSQIADDGVSESVDSNPFVIGSKGGTEIPVESPAGTDSGGATTGDPDSAPRKRGRKPGSKNGQAKSKKTPDLNISGLEKILFSVHLALSAATKVPELALDESEARQLAEAAAEVQSHYEASFIDPKTMAWIQLGMVAASVYGPRAVVVMMRKKQEKEAKHHPQDNVVNLNRG
jgi:hypothetical protein